MNDDKPAGKTASSNKTVLFMLVAGVLILAAAAVVWYVRNAPNDEPTQAPPIVEPPAAMSEPLVIRDESRPLASIRSDAGPAPEDEAPSSTTTKRRTGASAASEKTGYIDPRVVNSFINSRFSQVRACYETRLKKNALLEGTVDMNIEIASSGKVTGVTINDDTVRDPEMLDCVKRRIRSWTFPQPEGGKVVIAKSFKFQKAS